MRKPIRRDRERAIINWILDDEMRMIALKAASHLGLEDWCLAAGFVRNLVWDKLHDFKNTTPLNDIDLVHFTRSDTSEETDKHLEQILRAEVNFNWSVKNQARMHIRNGDNEYDSIEDAMSNWPEIETAFGVSLDKDNEMIIRSPFCYNDLFRLKITRNPNKRDLSSFESRVVEKQWQKIWPKLKVMRPVC